MIEPDRPLEVGDVVLYMNDELWLAGALTLDDVGTLARYFVVPGARSGTWLAELYGSSRSIALLQREEQLPGGTLPEQLPLRGARLRVKQRASVAVRVSGEHIEHVGQRARYAQFEGPGSRVLAVIDFEQGQRLALSGVTVPRALLELLPGSSPKK